MFYRQIVSSFLVTLCVVAFTSQAQAKQSAWDVHQAWDQVADPLVSHDVKSTFPFMACFKTASKLHDLPLPLLLAVARGESDFDAQAESKANAIGVMQIQWPGTAKHLGIDTKQSLYNPCINIEAGTRYLKQLIARYDDLNMAIAAYNYGPGRIKKSMNWASLPSGAKWYSEYILDHFNYITRDATIHYAPSNKLILAEFNEPFRAKSMTLYFHKKMPGLVIDWFEHKDGKYAVTASFDDDQQRHEYLPQLAKLGFK